MSENYNLPNNESAEQKYVIDRESGYFKALEFSTDPVTYFSHYRKELFADGFEDTDVCQQALSEMAELEDVLGSEDVQVQDARVKEMLVAEYGSEAWVRLAFGILKEAGFTREQALAWVILADDELTNEELLKERTVRYFIQEVYNDK